MRLEEPRIDPIELDDADEETRLQLDRLSQDGHVLGIYRTLANHPKLMKRWMVFGAHVLNKSTLPARDREILILRVGWLCRAEYEWSMHVAIGRMAGLTAEEIERVAAGPDAAGWDPFEATLVRAADELLADAFIGESTWQLLRERYDTQQLMDVIFAVGQYNLVSMALNTFGVQLEEGVARFPKPSP